MKDIKVIEFSIEAGWNKIEKELKGLKAPDLQMTLIKHAYYAGASRVFYLCTEVASNFPESVACMAFDSIQGELDECKAEIETSNALNRMKQSQGESSYET